MKFRRHHLEDCFRLDGAKIKDLFATPEDLMEDGQTSERLSSFWDGILMECGYRSSYEEGGDALPFDYSSSQYKSFSGFAVGIGNMQLIDDRVSTGPGPCDTVEGSTNGDATKRRND